MPLIHSVLQLFDSTLPVVNILVSRHTIQKTRWRGEAEDGTDFAFELEQPLYDGDTVAIVDSKLYRLKQLPEAVLLVAWPSKAVEDAAWLGWELGNLHQPIEIREEGICVCDDPAVRAKLSKLEYASQSIETVFRPGSATTGHHDGHAH